MEQKTNSLNKKAYIKYISSLLLFGTNGIIASFILLPSNDIVFLRSLIGSILLLLIFLASQNTWTFLKYRKDIFFAVLSGAFMACSWSFLYEAYQQIGVSLATLLYYCGPIIVMAISPVLFKEKITPRKLISILIVLFGVVLINRGASISGLSFFGILCGILAAFFYAFMVIFGKLGERIGGFEKSVIQLISTFLFVLLFRVITKGFSFEFSGGNWIPILLLGLSTGIGCYLYFSPLSKIPAQTIAISGYLEPLSAVLLSVLILRERMLPVQIIGAVFILGGAILGEIRFKKSDRKIIGYREKVIGVDVFSLCSKIFLL
ncbi:MAG: EamA family transporter [Gallicola sp.]|nr:EamA family transporter [Gallicola sp.]